MNCQKLAKLLEDRKEVFMRDDFHQAAIHYYYDKSGLLKATIRYKGKGVDHPINPSAEIAADIELGGEYISKKEYEAF